MFRITPPHHTESGRTSIDRQSYGRQKVTTLGSEQVSNLPQNLQKLTTSCTPNVRTGFYHTTTIPQYGTHSTKQNKTTRIIQQQTDRQTDWILRRCTRGRGEERKRPTNKMRAWILAAPSPPPPTHSHTEPSRENTSNIMRVSPTLPTHDSICSEYTIGRPRVALLKRKSQQTQQQLTLFTPKSVVTKLCTS